MDGLDAARRWLAGLSARQAGGLLAIGGLLAVGALVAPRGVASYTAEEAERLGWTSAPELATDVHERVNDERVERGLPPLAWDDDLAESAVTWSERMLADGAYEHSPDEFREHPRFRGGSAENIAKGVVDTGELHTGWMASDGHREAILSPDLDAIGVGIVCRGDGVMWATQIFGRAEPGPPRPGVDDGPEPVVRDDAGPSCP